MAEWSLDLGKYANGSKAKIKEVRKAYAFALYSSIVRKTPVDTGRARGNWNISTPNPDLSTSESSTKQKYTQKEQLPEPNGDDPIYISNNLPYIAKLEYGGFPNPPKKGTGKTVNGFSKQAPEGMVGVTLANNENIYNAAVRSVQK